MLLYLHNLTSNDIVINDIGYIIEGNSYIKFSTSDLVNILTENGDLYNLIENEYNVKILLAKDVNKVNVFTKDEAKIVLRNGVASEVYVNKSELGLNVNNVQDALLSIKNLINSSISGLIWRDKVAVLTGDSRLNISAPYDPIDLTSFGNLSDDDDGNYVFNDGDYVLFTNGSVSNLFKVNTNELVYVNGGLSNGYTFLVEYDLTETPDSREKAAIYSYNNNKLYKIGSFNFNLFSLQDVYNNGNQVVLTVNKGFLIKDSGGVNIFNVNDTGSNVKIEIKAGNDAGDEVIIEGNNIKLKDNNNELNFSQSGIVNFNDNAGLWHASTNNIGFVFNRASNITIPNSIVGGINVVKEDLNDYINKMKTAPNSSSDSKGSNLVYVKGISEIKPSNHNVGESSNLQEMLEGVVEYNKLKSFKKFDNLASFITYKTNNYGYLSVNEIVFISDINRFVKVLTVNSNVSENVDWVYVGGENSKIGGSGYYFNTEVVFKNDPATRINKLGSVYYDSVLKTLMVYDSGLGRYISVNKMSYTMSSASVNTTYLFVDNVRAANSGILIDRDMILLRLSMIHTSSVTNKQFSICNNSVVLFTFTVPNNTFYSDYSYVLPAGTILQCRGVGATTVTNAVLNLVLAYI